MNLEILTFYLDFPTGPDGEELQDLWGRWLQYLGRPATPEEDRKMEAGIRPDGPTSEAPLGSIAIGPGPTLWVSSGPSHGWTPLEAAPEDGSTIE